MRKRGKNIGNLIPVAMVLLAFMLVSSHLYAAKPWTITYQGTVTEFGGSPPSDGTYAMRFTLFDDESASSQKWQETHSGGDAVQVTNGCYSVELGSISSFPANFFQDNPNLWLEVEIDLDGDGFETSEKYSPRVPLTAAPYAFQADAAQSAMKNLMRNFVLASGESVSAGDVVVFIKDSVKKGPKDLPDFGSESIFNDSRNMHISATALSDTKFAVAYRDIGNFNYGMAVVGEVSGNSIVFGSEYIFNVGGSEFISVAALSDTKFVIAYRDNDHAGYGTVIVGDVAGNSITYGSEYAFNSASTLYPSITVLSVTKFVVAYTDKANSNYGTAIVCEVSGTVIHYGGEYVFNSAFTSNSSAATLSDTKFVVAYTDGGNGKYGTAIVGEAPGYAISYGSEYIFNSAPTDYIFVAGLAANKFVVAYRDNGNSGYGTARVGNVSGNSITYGSEYVFNNAHSYYNSTVALSNTKFIITYSDGGNSRYGTAVVGDVSGDFIGFGSECVFNNAETYYISAAALAGTQIVVAYADGVYGTAIVGEAGIPLGIADAAASSGQTVPVILHGISDHHSGLVPGKFYYAQPDGSLTANWTSTRIGLAISATELLLDIER